MIKRSSKLGGGGNPVGSFSFAPTQNPLLTMGDGSQWLRAGLVLPTAGYAEAQAVSHLRAHLFTRSITQTAGLVRSMATDGLGNFVVAVPLATSLYVSNDNGATWNTRAHGIAGSIGAVVWTGTRFVVAGNDTTGNVSISYSTDGIVWTGVFIGTVGTSFPAGAVDLAWNGSVLALMIPNQTISQTIYTSPTGLTATWVPRTYNATLAPTVNSRIAGSALGFVVTGVSSVMYSTNNGVAWTFQGTASNVNGVKPMMGAGWIAIPSLSAAGAVNYSTNLASWSTASSSTVYATVSLQQGFGTIWSATDSKGQLLTTVDGISWTVQVVAPINAQSLPPATDRMFCIGPAAMICVNSATFDYIQAAASTVAASNGVGGTPLSTGSDGLWRIK